MGNNSSLVGRGDKEQRHHPRSLNFCWVSDAQGQLVGITTDFSEKGIFLLLLRSFLPQTPCSLTLIREDSHPSLQVTVTARPIWRRRRNAHCDEIGVEIVQPESEEDWKAFINYCQQHSPCGVFPPEHPATRFFQEGFKEKQ